MIPAAPAAAARLAIEDPFEPLLELAPLPTPLVSCLGLAFPAMVEMPSPIELPRLPRVSPTPLVSSLSAPPGSGRLLADLAGRLDRGIRRLEQPLDDVGVLVERGQRAVQDVVGVLEPDLELALGLHVLEVDLHLVDPDVHAGDQVDEVRDLRSEREVRVEALDVDLELAHADFRHEDVDVGLVGRGPAHRLAAGVRLLGLGHAALLGVVLVASGGAVLRRWLLGRLGARRLPFRTGATPAALLARCHELPLSRDDQLFDPLLERFGSAPLRLRALEPLRERRLTSPSSIVPRQPSGSSSASSA